MIQLTDVTKVFTGPQGQVRALSGLTLEIGDGEFVAIRGPSGCGKSTLLSLIGGLALPTSGRVTVDGREVSGMSSAARAAFRAERIGFVFQLFHLLPYLSVLDNVLVAAAQPAGRDVRSRAIDLLNRFGLADRLRHRPGQLSVGQRQRVAMARALLNGPAIVLADEPTGNLDPANAAAVLDFLSQYHAAGGTVVLVTHETEAAARARRVVSMDLGRIVPE